MKFPTLLTLALAVAIAPEVSHAQTTYTLGRSICSPGGMAYCYGVPATDSAGNVSPFWIDIRAYNLPLSSRFIDGIPGFTNGWAMVNYDAAYTYTTAVFHSGTRSATMVTSLTFDFVQIVINPDGSTSIPPNALTGTGTVQFGGYFYSAGGGGRGGGGAGWRGYVTGGTITVNQ